MFSISAASFLKRTFFASDLIAISPVLNITWTQGLQKLFDVVLGCFWFPEMNLNVQTFAHLIYHASRQVF